MKNKTQKLYHCSKESKEAHASRFTPYKIIASLLYIT